PLPALNIEDQGARGIRGVGGVHLAAGEPPDQETVYRAEGQLSRLSTRTRAGHVVEQPLYLGARKVGVEHEAGLLQEQRFVPSAAQRFTHVRGTPALPNDGVC